MFYILPLYPTKSVLLPLLTQLREISAANAISRASYIAYTYRGAFNGRFIAHGNGTHTIYICHIYATYMAHISAVYTLKLKLKFLHLHLLAKLVEKVLAVMYGLPPAPGPCTVLIRV